MGRSTEIYHPKDYTFARDAGSVAQNSDCGDGPLLVEIEIGSQLARSK